MPCLSIRLPSRTLVHKQSIFVRLPRTRCILATRCYRFYRESKNHSEARANCRKFQADLYSWRDNTDENELLTASTSWNYVYQPNKHQFYTWSGGIVHHGQGSLNHLRFECR